MIGERLRNLRLESGFTQTQLAEMIGVSRQQIVRYQSGESNIGVKNLKVFARFFNVSTDYLLGLTDKRLHLEVI